MQHNLNEFFEKERRDERTQALMFWGFCIFWVIWFVVLMTSHIWRNYNG